MKKIIGLSCVFLFIGFVALGQTTAQKTALSKKQSTTCKTMSPEDCAASLGISLEEYLKLPKKCNGTAMASIENTQPSVLKVAARSDVKTANISCGSSLEECAKKMGMTVEECKAICKSSSNCQAVGKASVSVASVNE